jgi:hypothetical protein
MPSPARPSAVASTMTKSKARITQQHMGARVRVAGPRTPSMGSASGNATAAQRIHVRAESSPTSMDYFMDACTKFNSRTYLQVASTSSTIHHTPFTIHHTPYTMHHTSIPPYTIHAYTIHQVASTSSTIAAASSTGATFRSGLSTST